MDTPWNTTEQVYQRIIDRNNLCIQLQKNINNLPHFSRNGSSVSTGGFGSSINTRNTNGFRKRGATTGITGGFGTGTTCTACGYGDVSQNQATTSLQMKIIPNLTSIKFKPTQISLIYTGDVNHTMSAFPQLDDEYNFRRFKFGHKYQDVSKEIESYSCLIEEKRFEVLSGWLSVIEEIHMILSEFYHEVSVHIEEQEAILEKLGLNISLKTAIVLKPGELTLNPQFNINLTTKIDGLSDIDFISLRNILSLALEDNTVRIEAETVDELKGLSLELQELLDEKEQKMEALEYTLNEKEQEIQTMKQSLDEKEQGIQTMKQSLDEKDQEIQTLKHSLNQKEYEIQTLKLSSNEKNELGTIKFFSPTAPETTGNNQHELLRRHKRRS
eukprot:TRINITY_DN336_c0_g1_i5.p1 TRINITY_DN336_c0_g1~~TRINITY_DN336_c0_g1_i5.p1  ORF type:complete len:395 (-),score=87.31 TRINITY_DN336_c0_g1_i5:108-1262(-)